MTLKEKIRKLKKDIIVKIGSGSNFFYAYYKNDLTNYRIKNESDKQLEWYKRQLRENEIRYDNLPKKYELQIAQLGKDYPRKTTTYYRKVKELRENQIKETKFVEKSISNYTRYIKEFTPFLDREVITSYMSDELFEPNTVIILVKGREMGRYALIDEYAYVNKLHIRKKDMHFPQERLKKVEKLGW